MFRAFCLSLLFAAAVHADILADVRIGLGEYYGRPQRDIVLLQERNVPADELPVVLFIAGQTRLAPLQVWEYRRSGLGWARIASRYGISAEVFYVPISVNPAPPYGHAYGYYRKYPRRDWHRVPLDDDDIVALVNLRFYSEHYRLPPDRIVVRSGGGPFYKVIEVADREHWKGVRGRENGGGHWAKGPRGASRKSHGRN